MIDLDTKDDWSYGMAVGSGKRLDGVPIYLSARMPEGSVIIRRSRRERYVMMHPRTQIALLTPDLVRRLELLLAWNLKQALIPFDSKHFGLAMAA